MPTQFQTIGKRAQNLDDLPRVDALVTGGFVLCAVAHACKRFESQSK